MAMSLDWGLPFRAELGEAYDIVVTSVILYLFIIAAVRVLGVRSISHMNNFDWITIVAIGAISGASIVTPQVTAVHGMLAIGALFGMQWLVTWLASRSDTCANLFKENPRVLVQDGRVDKELLKHERVTEEEVMAEVRGKGLENLDQVKAVVLESDSTVSVVPKDAENHQVAMQNVDD